MRDWFSQVKYVDQVDSTMHSVKEAAQQGAAEGFTLWAGSQSQGRGRQGRDWYSPAEGGLYFTTLLRPPVHEVPLLLEQSPTFSLVSGLALAQSFEEEGIQDIRLKWPNDILIGGKKCAGILLECLDLSPEQCTILLGIGINLEPESETHRQMDLSYGYVGLSEALPADKGPISAGDWLKTVLGNLQQSYGRWRKEGFAPFADLWRAYDYLFAKEITALCQSEEIRGIARGVSERGHLCVETQGKIVQIDAGEVHLV